MEAEDPDDPNTPNGKIAYSFLDDGSDSGIFEIGLSCIWDSDIYFSVKPQCPSNIKEITNCVNKKLVETITFFLELT